MWSSTSEHSHAYNNTYSNQSRGYYQTDYENSFIQKLGSAIGSSNSTTTTGSGNDQLRIDSVSYTESIGIKYSSINLDEGDDTLTINSSAFGYNSYIRRNLGSYDYSGNHQSARKWSDDYSHSYRYSNSSSSYGHEYSRSYEHEWDYGYDYSGSGIWNQKEGSGFINTGISISVSDPNIRTGSGDDSINITSSGSARSVAIENSEISASDGNDYLEIYSEALSKNESQGNGEAIGISYSTINTESEDDALLIEAIGESKAIGVQNSIINTGSSDDVVDLIVEATNEKEGIAIGLTESKISTGREIHYLEVMGDSEAMQ